MKPNRTLRWILLSIAVIAAVLGMVRLGFWQLDRLEQRRSFNARVRASQAMPVLDLSLGSEPGLEQMEYRQVQVRGRYLSDQQVILRNQVDSGRIGVHLLTPLEIEGTGQAVLVDRGWIPLEESGPDLQHQYDETGLVVIHGVLRLSGPGLRTGSQDTSGSRLVAVNVVNLPALASQTSVSLLPVYIQAAPLASAGDTLPIRSLVNPELTEGSHAGYTLQWFTFAAVLAGGYPYFVYTRLIRKPGQKKLRLHSAASIEMDH